MGGGVGGSALSSCFCKRKYLFTGKVRRYCILPLHCSCLWPPVRIRQSAARHRTVWKTRRMSRGTLPRMGKAPLPRGTLATWRPPSQGGGPQFTKQSHRDLYMTRVSVSTISPAGVPNIRTCPDTKQQDVGSVPCQRHPTLARHWANVLCLSGYLRVFWAQQVEFFPLKFQIISHLDNIGTGLQI